MLKLTDVKKQYLVGDQELTVLKGISLEIKSGEFVAIMGPSGSGKSTLMNMLGLLDTPTSGSFELMGRDISNLDEDQLAVIRSQVIGFIFQQFNLLPRLNAVENVALPLLYSSHELDYDRARMLLTQVGLEKRLDHRPNQLSGGQQQRVAIARSLVNKPTIILADEPTGNLDSQSSEEILKLLSDLNAQGMTIILVTHELDVALKARRIIHIRDGLVQSDERTDQGEIFETLPPSIEPHPTTWVAWLGEFEEYFRQGLKTLFGNKVRTMLSMLGILIGVASVIAMLAVGHGARKAIEAQLAALGSNLLVLRPAPIRVPGGGAQEWTQLRVTADDATVIQQRIPAVKLAAAVVDSANNNHVTYGAKSWTTHILGVGAEYAEMHSTEPTTGRFFTKQENQSRSMVTVIGATVARELFADQDPLGKTIKANKVNLLVIGVLPEKGSTGFQDQDDVLIVPLTSAMYRLLGKQWVDYIEIEVQNQNAMAEAESSVLHLMQDRRTIPLSQQNDAFYVRNLADVQNAMSDSSRTMSLLLASIAAISLLVGGIGIMNIMLVSVTERTREIGLRKAIGARRQDILLQFLIESAVVGTLGGLAGVILGVTVSLLLRWVMGWATAVSLESVVISFGFAVSIGLIFGLWPALKASRLNPIEALRYE
jgi:macrolide transport system ATP-binding/permease protein